MTHICSGCIDDSFLKEIVEQEGEREACSGCGETENNAITVERLGQIIEPIMRRSYTQGEYFGRGGQHGDSMADIVQEVLGQYFDFEDEIVAAVIQADDFWPPDGGEAYWDDSSCYVRFSRPDTMQFSSWENTANELKYNRRFFSPAAQDLFDKLFKGVETLYSYRKDRPYPVVRTLPIGTVLYRARVFDLGADLAEFYAAPMKNLGPPPYENARAGRMNAEGVVVLYCARDEKTCLAEMRPALRSEIAMFQLKTTSKLRVLDFPRLEQSRHHKKLSDFDPNYEEEMERRDFLLKLHSLISQPIAPGHEADYLITQTMAEYLAHVHELNFDGILFASAQKAGGVNVVLFSDRELLTSNAKDSFHVEPVPNSMKCFTTSSISYRHFEEEILLNTRGEPFTYRTYEREGDW